MKFKYFILLFVLLLTGCSVQYDLKFEQDTIKEKIDIKAEHNSDNQSVFNRDYYAIINASTSNEYNKVLLDDGYEFSYDYGFEEFRNSRFLNCYDAYSLNTDNNVITFSTSKQFKCLVYDYMPIDNVVINISTDYEVVDNNADAIEGNVYKWNINNNNFSNKPIKFSYKKKIVKKSLFDLFKNNKDFYVVLLSCICLLVVIALFIIIKNKRVNKI